MKDPEWHYGDANMMTAEEEQQMNEQQNKYAREDFFQLVNDVIVDCKFLEAVNALREQLEWHVRRNL